MARCEDYPCCGHTDGLGCDYEPDRAYIWAHALCEHEIGYCDVAEREREELDPEDCEHGNTGTWRGRVECDDCGSPLVMVTDTTPRAYPSRVVPGLWVEITVIGWHYEVRA